MLEKLIHSIAAVFGYVIAAVFRYIATVFGLRGTRLEIRDARAAFGILTMCLLAVCGAFYLTGPLQAIVVTVAIILLVMTVVALGSPNA